MKITLEFANEKYLASTLDWLKNEYDELGEGFYCNRKVISKSFMNSTGFCAVYQGSPVGFTTFDLFIPESTIYIIEVHPALRRHGIGSQLLKSTIEWLHINGAKCIEVECTGQASEAFCKKHGFNRYTDPNNYNDELENPTLRRYLADWRSPQRSPWQ